MNKTKKLPLVKASTSELKEAAQLEETCGVQLSCGPCLNKRIPCSCLQRFATVRWALVFFSIGGFSQGFIVNGLIPSIISTLEKRFGLSSTESGLIASCYEIASTAVVLFVTYLGGRGHKPLWIAHGIFMIGLSGVIFSLPYFLATPYTFSESSKGCGKVDYRICEPSEIRVYRFVFYLAMLISGAGSTPLFSLGVVYLDENVQQRYSALYEGIFVMMSILGPGIGYVAGGMFLSIYTHPYEEVSINESNYQWIGAWWLGSLLFGIIGIVASLPTFLLPRVIPGTENVRLGREMEVHERDKGTATDDFGKRLRDFPKSIFLLLSNPTYLFLTAAVTLDSLLIGGTAVFGPKFIEVQFGIDSSTAGTYFGLLTIVGGAGGQFLGGALLSKFDIKIKSMLHICYLSPLICFFFSFCFLITCAEQPFAGVVSPYHGQERTTNFRLGAPCNFGCDCSKSDFSPVCGDDKVTYFSPCFAGCKGPNQDELFTNCSCVPSSGNNSTLGTAVLDVCIDAECSTGLKMIIFCFCMFGIMFFTFSNEASAIQVSLRCVAFNKRSLSLGLQIFVLRALGTLPGPLVVGGILDSVCLRWSDDCGQLGSCLAYDNKNLALYIFFFIGFGKLLDAVMYFLAFLTYKRRSDESSNEIRSIVSSKHYSFSG